MRGERGAANPRAALDPLVPDLAEDASGLAASVGISPVVIGFRICADAQRAAAPTANVTLAAGV